MAKRTEMVSGKMVKIRKIDHDTFETLIIYKCLMDVVYLGTIVEYLKPEYFKNESIKDIIGIIKDFYIKNNVPPKPTEIKTYLTNDKLKQSFTSVVKSFESIDKDLNNKQLYDDTEIFLREKAVFNTLMDIVEKNEKSTIDTSEVLDKMQKACTISLTNEIGISYFEDLDKIIHELTKTENYISSGYRWVDEILGGGFLQKGKALYVFCGQTNIGKSIVLGNIATNICAQGKTVLLVSLEMSEVVYSKRLCGNFANIPIASLTHKLDDLKSEIEKFKRENPTSKLVIKEFPPSAITVGNLSAYIKKLSQTGIKPDAIIVDYVNLLTTSFGNNSYEKIKHITENLRGLSYTFNVPVITATQLNRSAINQSNPSLETMSESLGLAMTADCIFNLWREKEDEELGRINMGIQKNRQGPAYGKAVFAIDHSTMRMREETHANNNDVVSNTEITLNEIMS